MELVPWSGETDKVIQKVLPARTEQREMQLVAMKTATYSLGLFVVVGAPQFAVLGFIANLIAPKDADDILWTMRNIWNRMSYEQLALTSIVAFAFYSYAIVMSAALLGMYVGQTVMPLERLPKHGFIERFMRTQ